MLKGRVRSIHLASKPCEALANVAEARAIAGKGLEGDRYGAGRGTFSKKAGPDREVTLIETEALEALQRDYGVALQPGDARRNIVTQDVALNHLVGRTFRVGEALLKGIRLCEPCGHLAKLTSAKIEKGLVHRGGLRAQIVTSGMIRAGDAVLPMDGKPGETGG